MDATDRSAIVQAILNNESDNYLCEYLTRRKEQTSFTEDRHLEHNGYLASLQNIMNHDYNANAKTVIIMDKFEVRIYST